jgi:hypothetical protein
MRPSPGRLPAGRQAGDLAEDEDEDEDAALLGGDELDAADHHARMTVRLSGIAPLRLSGTHECGASIR